MAARTAGRKLLAFSEPLPGVTRSRFEGMTVLANSRGDAAVDVENDRLSPHGFVARGDDGSITCGSVEERLDSAPLSPGEHVLVIEKDTSSVVVSHPIGASTVLSVPIVARRVEAFDRNGRSLGAVPFTTSRERTSFTLERTLQGTDAPTYRATM